MSTTVRQAVTDALRLMGHMNGMGAVDENREAQFFGAAAGYLNLVCADVLQAGGLPLPQPVTGLDDPLPVPDEARRAVLFGLAMYFSIIDRDSELYNFFSAVYYGRLLPAVRADETPLGDRYGVARDPDFFG